MLCGGRKFPVSKYVVSSLLAAAASSVVCFDAGAVSTVVSWTAGNGSWSNAGNWSSAAVPLPGSYVSIVHKDSLNRLITFDSSYSDPLGQFTIDQTGTGTTTFSMSSGTIGTRYMTSDEQTIVGNFGKNLSHRGDTVILRDPVGNPANQVRYYGGGRWPEFASGGGFSLELSDPLEAFALKRVVTHRENLINQQNLRVGMDRDREAQPHLHSSAVSPYGGCR